MPQTGFYHLSGRYPNLVAKKDPRGKINALVPWEAFRPVPERVWRKPEEVFTLFDGHLARRGNIARGGLILDASIAPVPRNHNKPGETAAITVGETPGGRANKPAERCRRDVDASRTKSTGKSRCGCKNQLKVDRRHKLVRRNHLTDAAEQDSQAVGALLTRATTCSGVCADAACLSVENETTLKARTLGNRFHREGKRVKPLAGQARKSNRTNSCERVRVEHIFGAHPLPYAR